MEFSFAYGDSQAVLAQRAEAAAAAAAGLVGQDAADNTVAWLLYSRLLGQTDYSPEGGGDIYSALCLGTADSEGMALAYSLLCQQSGITCLLAQGTLNGQPHCWNLITMEDGVSWQVDVTRADPEGNFLHNDETMAAAGYNWSPGGLPRLPAARRRRRRPTSPQKLKSPPRDRRRNRTPGRRPIL